MDEKNLEQEQMNRQQTEAVPAVEMKPQKPKWPPLVFGLAGAAVVILVVAVLFATGVLGASPAKRYAKLQQAALTKLVDESAESYAEMYTQQEAGEALKEDAGGQYRVELALSEEAAKLFGMERGFGIEFSGKSFISADDQNVHVLTDYILNDNKLFGSDLFMNLGDSTFMLAIPELSSEYLFMDFKKIMEELAQADPAISGEQTLMSGTKTELLPAEDYQTIMNGLKDIWLKYSPENVTREKKAAIEKNGITVTADRYVASYTKGAMYDCMTELLTYLRDQKALEEYVVKITGITADEYKKSFEDQLAESAAPADREAEAFKVELGVTKSGVSSFELSVSETDAVLSGIWNAGQDEKEDAWMLTADGEEIEYRNKYKKTSDGLEGTMTVNAATAESGDFDVELVYDGVAYDEKAKTLKLHAVLNSSLLSGMGFGLTVDSSEQKQNMTVELILGNLSMGSLDISTEKIGFEEFSLPGRSYDLEDEAKLTEYLAGADVMGFIGTLAANKDVSDLLDMFGAWDLFGNVGDTGAGEGEEPDPDYPATPDKQVDFSSYTGYEADEDGWVSFSPDEAEVLAAGLGSTGFDSFEEIGLPGYGPFNKIEELIAEAYGERSVYGGSNTSYAIYGYEPYVASYYTTLYTWYDAEDEYYTNFNLSVDAVTGEIQSMEVYSPDMGEGFALTADMAENILGVDRNELKTAYEQAADAGSDYLTVSGVNMFWYDMGDYITFYLSPGYE